jgi:MarR-like DNA-binding transcriptional regulator SgrR of sgrS sRNA
MCIGRLQPGETFHNGEALDARTVKFSFERAAATARSLPVPGRPGRC